jgi:hypothetical protein
VSFGATWLRKTGVLRDTVPETELPALRAVTGDNGALTGYLGGLCRRAALLSLGHQVAAKGT